VLRAAVELLRPQVGLAMSGLEKLLGCACVVVAACGASREEAAPLQRAHLSAGIIAKVGTDEIALGTVQRIARAEGVSPQSAREWALRDAVLCGPARAWRSTIAAWSPSLNARLGLARCSKDSKKMRWRSVRPSDAEVAEADCLALARVGSARNRAHDPRRRARRRVRERSPGPRGRAAHVRRRARRYEPG